MIVSVTSTTCLCPQVITANVNCVMNSYTCYSVWVPFSLLPTNVNLCNLLKTKAFHNWLAFIFGAKLMFVKFFVSWCITLGVFCNALATRGLDLRLWTCRLFAAVFLVAFHTSNNGDEGEFRKVANAAVIKIGQLHLHVVTRLHLVSQFDHHYFSVCVCV